MLRNQIEIHESIPPQAVKMQKIAYILGRFPALSETFVQQEILELERQGGQICIFSLFKPDKTHGIEVTWSGQAPVTCIADASMLLLLMTALRYFLHAPLRFLRTSMAMLEHYRLGFLVGCRVLLSAAFLATQFEHEEILHMHAHFASEAASVAKFTYLLTGIPYSFTAHANDIYLSSPEALAYKMKMARFVITISTYNQTYLMKLADHSMRKRIHRIYNGLNLQEFPVLIENSSCNTRSPVILSVCRLVEKKGLLYLLQACRILADQDYKFICYIIGDGPLYHQLEQKIQDLKLADRVVLLGAKTHQQVIELYRNATLMALPCVITKNGDRDGLPTVLIEALYMGIPSVSTTISGIVELITTEENGLLVPPNDSEALAVALARLLDDPALRSRLAIAGHKTVQERFDLMDNVRSLMHLFYAN